MLKNRWFLYYIYALGCFGNRRVPEGLVPIIYVRLQKVVKKHWKTQMFVKSRFLLVCDRLLPFFIPKSFRNPPPRTPPGNPFLTFLGGDFSLGIVK